MPRWLAATMATLLLVTGCSAEADGDDDGDGETPALAGPLCDALPQGDDPGGPGVLTTEPADVALQWIPVLTNFEAGTRATGLDTDLGEMEAVTILAPTDDAFEATFSEDLLDDLILFRQDEYREVLESHLVEGTHSLPDLVEAGRITTLAGDTVTIEPSGDMARLDGRVHTLCTGYQVANATIHITDGLLGDLPEGATRERPDET